MIVFVHMIQTSPCGGKEIYWSLGTLSNLVGHEVKFPSCMGAAVSVYYQSMRTAVHETDHDAGIKL